MVDYEDGLNFHASVYKIRLKACVNPIKTIVNRVILRVNDLLRVKIKIILYFTPYITKLDRFFTGYMITYMICSLLWCKR